MKYTKISLQVKFLYREEKVFQYFVIVDTKLKKYVLNSCYVMYEYFEDFIVKNSLSNIDSDFQFISRRDEDDRITLEFSYEEGKEIEKLGTYYYTLSGDIPFSNGCEECRFLKEEGDTLYCEKKEKYLNNKLKTCKIFSQKRSTN